MSKTYKYSNTPPDYDCRFITVNPHGLAGGLSSYIYKRERGKVYRYDKDVWQVRGDGFGWASYLYFIMEVT